MSHQTSPTELYRFRVNCTPYQLIHVNLDKFNLSYIKSFDPDYFRNVGVALQKIEDIDHSKIAIRQLYLQQLETFFPFLFAFLQAPNAMFAWLNLYDPVDTRELVKRISLKQDTPTEIKLEEHSWSGIID